MQILAGWVVCVWLAVLLAIWVRLRFSKAMRTTTNFICDQDTSPTAFNTLVSPNDAPQQYAGDPNPWPKVTIIAQTLPPQPTGGG